MSLHSLSDNPHQKARPQNSYLHRVKAAVKDGSTQSTGGLNVGALRKFIQDFKLSEKPIHSLRRSDLCQLITSHPTWPSISQGTSWQSTHIPRLVSGGAAPQKHRPGRTRPLGVTTVHAAEHAGYKEPTEDRHTVLHGLGVTVMAVFDGHGGARASEAANKMLPRWIIDAVLASTKSPAAISHILSDKFALFQRDLLSRPSPDGTCATVCVLTETHVVTAHVGDSPAIMFMDNGEVLHSTEDHTCNNPGEAERMDGVQNPCYIEHKRDRSVRVLSGIVPTRSFGDEVDHTGVIAVPDISVWRRQPGAYFCVCSDSFAEGRLPSGKIGATQGSSEIVVELLRCIRRDGTSLEKATSDAVMNRVSQFVRYGPIPPGRTRYLGDNTTLLLTLL
jgi:serine/threonine protein phosphatase PrpC